MNMNEWYRGWIFGLLFIVCSCKGVSSEAVDNMEGVESQIDTSIVYQIDTLVNSIISHGIIPGAVISIVQDSTIVFSKAYGNRSLVPELTMMTENTIFDLASLSKCIATTLAVMQLIEKKELALDDKVNQYIPNFKSWVKGDSVQDITIQDLLTHSSGLEPYIRNVKSLYRKGCDSDSLMHIIATKSYRNFRPGTKFSYSCLNFITLQNIVERLTGERLCDYVQKNIFDTLGLTHTCYFPNDVEVPDSLEIAPTEVQPDSMPLIGRTHDPLARLLNGGNSGNAGVFSDVRDLSVLCMAIMNGGAINGRRILKKETVELMTRIPESNAPTVGRALGWDVSSSHAFILGDCFPSHKCICHTGYTGTSIIMDLEAHVAVILLTNRVHPKDKGSLKFLRSELSNIVSQMVHFK